MRSKDGLRSTYGTPRPAAADASWRDPAVIADPDHPGRVLGWLLTSTVDTFGNTIAYTLPPDPADPAGGAAVPDPDRLRRLRRPGEPGLPGAGPVHLPAAAGPAHRPPRRLPRHHRPALHRHRDLDEPGPPPLARTVTLAYTDAATRPADNGVSLLARVTVTGHDGDATQSLPPLEFGYSTGTRPGAATSRSADRRRRRPGPVAGQPGPGPGRPVRRRPARRAAAVRRRRRYWRNRGAGRLDLPRQLAAAPAGVALGDAGRPAAGRRRRRPPRPAGHRRRPGRLLPGLRRRRLRPGRLPPLPGRARFGLTDPDTRLIDLDGDGVTDALRTGTRLQVYLNDRAAAGSAQPAGGGSRWTRCTFTDPRVKLADMTGDGLTDVVLVASGRHRSTGPTSGYGRFGPAVIMADSPRFDDADLYGPTGFDPRRLLLGDVDGDGAADVVYVGPRGPPCGSTSPGNGFAAAGRGAGHPAAGRRRPRAARRPAGHRHRRRAVVLRRRHGHAAATTSSSTSPAAPSPTCSPASTTTPARSPPSPTPRPPFTPRRRAAGDPLAHHPALPGARRRRDPGHDDFSGTTLTTEYRYHHGYWDGADREFRGFARVDHRDTLTPPARAGDPAFSPPTETRTWFHPGPVGPNTGAWTELDFTGEYWPDDPPLAGHLDQSALPAGLPRRALREAVRGPRGTLLRTRLYAIDGTRRPTAPMRSATTPPGRTGPGRPHRRRPGLARPPVVTAQPTLAHRRSGNAAPTPCPGCSSPAATTTTAARTHADIGVPRGHDPAPPGRTIPGHAHHHQLRHPRRPRLYMTDRVTGTARHECADDGSLPALGFAQAALTGAAPTCLRGLELTYYDGPPFTGLGPGQLGEHGLPVRTEHLVITPDLLAGACQPGPSGDRPGHPALPAHRRQPRPRRLARRVPGRVPAGNRRRPPAPAAPTSATSGTGAALHRRLLRPASRHCYDVQAPPDANPPRGLVTVARDPYGGDTATCYDPYQLFPPSVTDPAGLTTRASHDYRVLKPNLVTDPNGNRTAVGYTPLGLPAFTARLGKDGASQGDTLDQPSASYDYQLTAWDDSAPPHPDSPAADERHHRPPGRAPVGHRRAGKRRRAAAGQPPLTDPEIAALFGPDERASHPERFVRTVEFSDGFGRLLQTRTQADDLMVDELGLADEPAAAAGLSPPIGRAGLSAGDGQRLDHLRQQRPPRQAATNPSPAPATATSRPSADQLATLARTTRHYDPRGLCIRTVAPDGSET